MHSRCSSAADPPDADPTTAFCKQLHSLQEAVAQMSRDIATLTAALQSSPAVPSDAMASAGSIPDVVPLHSFNAGT